VHRRASPAGAGRWAADRPAAGIPRKGGGEGVGRRAAVRPAPTFLGIRRRPPSVLISRASSSIHKGVSYACAWNLGTALGTSGSGLYNQLINGHTYYTQREYSDATSRCVLTGT